MNAPLRGTGLPNKVCNCPAGTCPRRALTNLSGSSIQTHQAPETVIARSAATWQSVPPQCERIAPAARPVMPPGRYGAPAGALQPHGLQGNGLPHQRARWFAMTDLGVRCVWRKVQRLRETDGGGEPPPYGTGHHSAPVRRGHDISRAVASLTGSNNWRKLPCHNRYKIHRKQPRRRCESGPGCCSWEPPIFWWRSSPP